MKAPFPYFGGKRAIIDDVWLRLGRPKHYIEPFCGSAAMLLGAPQRASLEVVNDANGFIANFWRSVKHQPDAVAEWADYPVSHIDLGARHAWLMEAAARVAEALHDPLWPGDPQMAGWWLWGQCSWIGSGWCEWDEAIGQIPHVSDAGRGVQAIGQIPHVGNAGMGDALTSSGVVARRWMRDLAGRLERVRVIHGSWERCLNTHYGGAETAIFFDPPYKAFEQLYGVKESVAAAVEQWARDNSQFRIALCGHRGDYDLPGWDAWAWSRGRLTYSGGKTTAEECVWYSPACVPVRSDLFSEVSA